MITRGQLDDQIRKNSFNDSAPFQLMYTHLVVEVGLECELAVADEAPEAARVEEGVVLERADLVGGVDRLAAPQARVVDVVARAEHHGGRRQHDLAARGARHRRRRGRCCKGREEGKALYVIH